MSKYQTKDEAVKWFNERLTVILMFFIIGIVFMMVYTMNPVDYQSRSILGGLYNFSDDECVSRANPLNDSWPRRCAAECANSGQITHECFDMCDIPSCTLYCHTHQIQDGETCETVNTYTECNATLRWRDSGELFRINYKTTQNYTGFSDYAPMAWTRNGNVVAELVSRECVLAHTEMICTPTYKNVTGLCATPEEINNVMEAVR